MKRLALALFVLTSAARAESVLFIGDSLTGEKTVATNEDMPAVLKRLAAARSEAVTFSEAIDLGQTLQTNWDAGIPQKFLTGDTQWDFISYQEFSTLPTSKPAAFDSTATQTYEPSLARSLAAGGQVLLFENWALANVSPFPNRAANVAALDQAYASLSKQLTVPNAISPIGGAFEAVFQTKPESYLIQADGKHPTDAAIYLNACVFYAMTFHESPVGLPALFLAQADATFLQGIVAQVTAVSAPDAGTPADAGTPPDAGTPDPTDAGTVTDAGLPGTQAPAAAPPASNQGCSSAGIGGALFGLLALIRRRGARGSRRWTSRHSEP